MRLGLLVVSSLCIILFCVSLIRISSECKFLTYNFNDKYILQNLYEGLVTINHKGQVVAGMASEWKISDDGKTYTFTIRPDAKWSDGTKVIPYDFVLSLRALFVPTKEHKLSLYYFHIKNSHSIATGKLPLNALGVKGRKSKLIIHLSKPYPKFLYKLATDIRLFPVPSHVEYLGLFTGISNGAYRVNQASKSKLELEPNPFYHGYNHLNIQKTVFYLNPDYKIMFDRGRLDTIINKVLHPTNGQLIGYLNIEDINTYTKVLESLYTRNCNRSITLKHRLKVPAFIIQNLKMYCIELVHSPYESDIDIKYTPYIGKNSIPMFETTNVKSKACIKNFRVFDSGQVTLIKDIVKVC